MKKLNFYHNLDYSITYIIQHLHFKLLNIMSHMSSKRSISLLQLFVYDTVKKHLSPKPGEKPKLPFPAPSVAGALAGVSSTLCTYPLELLKTRLTVQVYHSLESQ